MGTVINQLYFVNLIKKIKKIVEEDVRGHAITNIDFRGSFESITISTIQENYDMH